MAKTVLQAVNDVLKNTRDTQVTALTADYTQLILQFINIAKREVEDAWRWRCLRTAVTFDTVAGTQEYDLSSALIVTSATVTNDRSYHLFDPWGRLQAWDVTAGQETQMIYVPPEWAENEKILGTTNAGRVSRPSHISFYNNGTGVQVIFPDKPAAARNYRAQLVIPQDDFSTSNAATTITAPWRPIVLLATALAYAERAEELGPPPLNFQGLGESALAEAIAADMSSSDTVFRVV